MHQVYEILIFMERQHRLTDQIRLAIAQSRVSRYRIWKETGIDQATLSRFMQGKGGLSMNSLDNLGDCLDLSIVGRKIKSRRKDHG